MLCDAGALGPLLYLRGRYGHGGRLGYDREWRADPAVAGGGELLDQGVHLIDLSRWFLGDFVEVAGRVGTYFWNMPVEDNGFSVLRTAAGQVAWLHASCTEWKNLFCFEIFGRDGKLQIDGLGGSYGVERLTFYRMLPQMGPPETTIWEYPGEDLSWPSRVRRISATCIATGGTAERQPGRCVAAALRIDRRGSTNSPHADPGQCVSRRTSGPGTAKPCSLEEGDMIITRSPLRISLGGGGTDLPSYYRASTAAS